MEEFAFTIPESWEAVRHVLAHALGRSPDALRGVPELEAAWRESKAELLRLFPETGRVVVDLDPEDGDHTPPPEVCKEARDAAIRWLSRRLREKYGALDALVCPNNPEACGINVVYCYCVTFQCPVFRPLWAARKVLGMVSWEEIVSGRLTIERKRTLGADDKERQFPEGTRLGGFVRALLLEARFRYVPDAPEWGVVVYSEGEERQLADIRPAVARLTQWDVEQVVTAFSMMTSQLKTQKARLVISVNPLDLLLVSEHTTGWRSCHRLGGEYCTGPLAYMCDTATAVAYVYARTGLYEPAGVVLPVKMWRQMVYFDLDNAAAIFSRHYPERKPEFEKAARRAVAHLIARHLGLEGKPRWKYQKINGSGVLARGEDEEDTYRESSHCVKPVGRWHYQDDPSSGIRLGEAYASPEVGVDGIPCPVCGDWRVDETKNLLACGWCGAYRCSNCGSAVAEDEVHFVADDVLCEECFSEHCAVCASCGEAYCTDDMYYQDGGWYCDTCFHDIFTYCISCGEVVAREDAEYVSDNPYCSECFAELYAVCGQCGEPVRYEDAVGVDGSLYCRECAERAWEEVAGCES